MRSAISSRNGARSTRSAAADFALRSSEADGKKNLLENVARQWARNDPQAALAWAANLPETTRDSVFPGVIAVMAESDPREATKIVSRLSTAEAQSTATAAIAWQWAGSDPQAASKWAAALPENKIRQQAFESLMNRWSRAIPMRPASGWGHCHREIRATRQSQLIREKSSPPIRRPPCNGRRRSRIKLRVSGRWNRLSASGFEPIRAALPPG